MATNLLKRIEARLPAYVLPNNLKVILQEIDSMMAEDREATNARLSKLESFMGALRSATATGENHGQ